jgi:hypothetical protein
MSAAPAVPAAATTSRATTPRAFDISIILALL